LGLDLSDEEEGDAILEDFEIFYLWETLFDYYEIFKIVKEYFDENYSPSPTILLRLIDGRNLPLEEALRNIHYIRCGYVNTILPPQTK